MTNLELLTIVIAIYGAVISTIVGVAEILRNRPNIRVSAKHGGLITADGKNSELMVIMEATNMGKGAITLNSVGWMLSKKQKSQMLVPYNLNFPLELSERKSCSTYYPCRYFRGLKGANKMFGIFFQDETGKEWVGKISKQDRDLWMKTELDGWCLEWDPTHEIWVPTQDSK